MPFRQQVSKATGMREAFLPRSYQVVGDVVLLKLMKIQSAAQKKKIGAAVLELYPRIKTVCEILGVENEFREPRIKKLAGNGTETVHREHGILYKMDAAKVMFSKGNLNERQRIIAQIRGRETVVDMFAGIGYFALGIAKFSPAGVVAIEKNRTAYSYLIENIRLNRIASIKTILGDCVDAAKNMENTADRVIMGYLPNTERFLPAALHMLKQRGTVHFHNTYNRRELWDMPLTHIKTACGLMGIDFEIVEKKKVKSYAPNVFHTVADIMISKK